MPTLIRKNLRVVPDKAEMWSDDNGVSWLRFLKDAEVDEKDLKEIIELAKVTIVPDQLFRVVADIREMNSISPAARKYGSKADHEAIYSALAIIAASTATRLIANFFIKFHKPPRPTRIFSDEESALKWLEKYK